MSTTYKYSNSTGETTAGFSIDNTRRIFNFGDRVAEIEPAQHLFFSYLSRFRKVPTDDPKFKFLEQRHQWQRRNFNLGAAIDSADYTSGTTTATLVTYCNYDKYGREQSEEYVPEFFLTNQVVTVADSTGTPRPFRITAVPTFTSGTGNLSLTALALFTATGVVFNDNAKGQVIGSAFAEATGAPDSWKDELYDRDGYTQIFKTAIPIFSGTAQATRYRGRPNELLRVWKEKLKEHAMDLNTAAMFGIGAAGGGNDIQRTWGILPYTELYGKNYSFSYSSFKYDDFLDAMEDFFAPESGNSTDKLVLASRKIINRMNRLGSGGFLYNTAGSSNFKLDIQQIKGIFGHNVTDVNTVFGNLHFVASPLLRGLYEDYAIAVDLKNVAWRPLKGNGISRDTFIKTNVQDPDVDGRIDLITTEAGLEIDLPETHAILKFS